MVEVRVIVPKDMDIALDALIRAGFAGNKAELVRSALTQFLSALPTQISRGYDLQSAFSPDGRIFQLEYARECINRGGNIMGVCCSEGVVLAKEIRREELSLSVMPNPFTKIFPIRDHIGVIHSGLIFDGHLLIKETLKEAESLEAEGFADIEMLVENVWLFMHSYSLKKTVRPLGTALLIGGVDSRNNPRLFLLESSGLAMEYKACTAGSGRLEAEEVLTNEYKSTMSLEDAIMLVIRATAMQEKRAENLLIATIDTASKKIRELTMKEKQDFFDRALSL